MPPYLTSGHPTGPQPSNLGAATGCQLSLICARLAFRPNHRFGNQHYGWFPVNLYPMLTHTQNQLACKSCLKPHATGARLLLYKIQNMPLITENVLSFDVRISILHTVSDTINFKFDTH